MTQTYLTTCVNDNYVLAVVIVGTEEGTEEGIGAATSTDKQHMRGGSERGDRHRLASRHSLRGTSSSSSSSRRIRG